jgi:hypothetical protein
MSGESSQNLRFDLTDLYLTAPTFERAGDSIGGTVSQTQSQLDGLGAFWGNDAPGEKFGAVYAKYQAELLNLLGITAAEVRGVSGGINQMADNYNVTEQANVRMAMHMEEEEQQW